MKRKAKLVLILTAILLMTGVIVMRLASTRGEKRLDRAEVAISAEHYDKALELIDSYQQRYPDSARAAYLQARALVLKGSYAAAEEAMQQAETLGVAADKIAILRGMADVNKALGLFLSDDESDIMLAPQLLDQAQHTFAAIETEDKQLRLELLNRRMRASSLASQAWSKLANILDARASAEMSRRPSTDMADDWTPLLDALPIWRRQGVQDSVEAVLGTERAEMVRLSDLRYTIDICEKIYADPDPDAEKILASQCRIVLADSLLRAASLASTGEPYDIPDDICDRVWSLTGEIIAEDTENPHAAEIRALSARIQAVQARDQSNDLIVELVKLWPDNRDIVLKAAETVLEARLPGYYFRIRDAIGGIDNISADAALILLEYELGRARASFVQGKLFNERLAEIIAELDRVVIEDDSDKVMVNTYRAELVCEMGDYDTLAILLDELRDVKGRSKVASRLELLELKLKIHKDGLKACQGDILKLRANYPNMFSVCELQARLAHELGDYAAIDRQVRDMKRMVTDTAGMSPVQRVDIKCRLADLCVQTNDLATATRQCKEVIMVDSSHARAWLINLMARAYVDQDNAKALRDYAIAAKGTDYEHYVTPLMESVIQRAMENLHAYSVAFTQLDMSEDAAPRKARDLFQLFRQRLDYLFVCSEVYRLNGNDAKRDELISAMAEVPVPGSIHAVSLAQTLARLDAVDSAVDILSDERWISDIRVKTQLIDLFGRTGRGEDASAMAASMEKSGLEADSVKLIRAMILLGTAQQEQAKILIGELDQIAASLSVNMQGRLARIHIAIEDYDGAMAVVNAMSEPAMSLPENMSLKIELLSLTKNMAGLESVVEFLFSGHEPAEMLPVACRELAKLYNAQGRLDEALSLLEKLARVPDIKGTEGLNWTEANFQIATLLSANGLYDASVERCFELVHKGLRGNSAGLLVLGRALLALGRPGEAAETLAMIEKETREYLQASLIMADMIPDDMARERRLARLALNYSMDESILVRRMGIWSGIDTSAAVRLYRDFARRQGDALNVSSTVAMAVASMLWEDGKHTEAIELLRHAYECTPSAAKALNVALLSGRENPGAALELIEAEFARGREDSLLNAGDAMAAATAVSLAVISQDQEAAGQWRQEYVRICSVLSERSGTDFPASREFAALVDFVSGMSYDRAFADDLMLTGYGREAIADLKDRTDPVTAARLLLALIAGDIGQSGYAYSMALELLEADKTFQWPAVVVFSNASDIDKAAKAAESLTLADCSTAIVLKAQAAALRNDYESAVTILSPVAATIKDAYLDAQLAVWLHDSGHEEEAVKLALESWQEHQLPVMANTAAFFIISGADVDSAGMDRAMELATAAYESMPDDANLLDTLGWIEYVRGNYEQASIYMARSLAQIPASPAVQYHMAMIDLKLGRTAIARMRLAAAANISDDMKDMPQYARIAARAAAELDAMKSE